METTDKWMDDWFEEVLSKKNIVEQLLISEDTDSILVQFEDRILEEIKICADLLSNKDKKYSQIAELVHQYQIKVGYLPDFEKKVK